MFTGIVVGMATVESLTGSDELSTLTLSTDRLPEDSQIGDSICISGCCLTITAHHDNQVSFEVMGETLRKTTLGIRQPGDQVNIEPALRPQSQLGGHIVSGHVDGIGEVVDITDKDGWHTVFFRVPDTIRRLVSPKGSSLLMGRA